MTETQIQPEAAQCAQSLARVLLGIERDEAMRTAQLLGRSSDLLIAGLDTVTAALTWLRAGD